MSKRTWRYTIPNGHVYRRWAELDPAKGLWSAREVYGKVGDDGTFKATSLAWLPDGPFCSTQEQVEAVLEAMGSATGWTEEER
jgi:hypothetical protein